MAGDDEPGRRTNVLGRCIEGVSSVALNADALRRRLPSSVQHTIVRAWYDMTSRWLRNSDITFLDCGWAELDPQAPVLPLRPEDEPDRHGMQLYHHVVAGIDLRGKDVLEVGCGRGGGASYVKRYLGPRSMLAVDISGEAIEACRRLHRVEGLTFLRADAHHVDVAPESFDAVINVESSGSYPSMERFLADVAHWLRPGGHFLFADMRERERVDTLRRQLRECGLELVSARDISAHAVRALEIDEGRKRVAFDQGVPRLIRPFFDEFAAASDTNFTTDRLRHGQRVFLTFVLRKPGNGVTPRKGTPSDGGAGVARPLL